MQTWFVLIILLLSLYVCKFFTGCEHMDEKKIINLSVHIVFW